jgi:YVTN family beta-propeller protein
MGGYKVMIIDAVTGVTHHEITAEHLPHNAAFNPSGSELWVPQSADAGEVVVYETSNYTELKTIAVGKMPSELTFSADGSRVFVANTGDATLTIIDPVAKTVLHTVTVGLDPVGAWPAANGKMYVDNETSQTVQEIDVVSAMVTATIDLGFKPGYAAFQAHHQELWVTDATHGQVVYFKFENGHWIKKGDIVTGADAHAIVFSSNNQTAFVTNQGANTVSVIDIGSHSKTKDITVGSKPNGLVLKP